MPGVENKKLGAKRCVDAGSAAGLPMMPKNQSNRGLPLLRQPKDLTGLSIIGSGVTQTIVTRNGLRCVQITLPVGASGCSLYFNLPAGFTANGKIAAQVEFEDISQFNGGMTQLNLVTDGNFNVGMRYTNTVGAGSGWNGSHLIGGDDAQWTTIGAGSWASAFTLFQLKFTAKAGGVAGSPTKVWVYEVVQGEKDNLPFIMIGADDGHATWYNDGLPIVEKYGLRSYLAYINDVVDTPNYMTTAQWQDVVARGHEVVVHGPNAGRASLRDYFTNYAPYATPFDAIVADLKNNRDGMVARGLDPTGLGRKCYVYPQGNHQPSGTAGDNTIISALKSLGFEWGRLAATNGSFTTGKNFVENIFYAPIQGHWWSSTDENANIAAIISAMNTEINAGRNFVLMQHIVRTTPTAVEDISPANLEKLCAAAASLINQGKAVNMTPTESLLAFKSR